MEHEGHLSEDYSSDAASHPFYETHVHVSGERTNNLVNEPHARQSSHQNFQATTGDDALERRSPNISSMSSSKFQEMVLHALFQSTASLIGSSSSLLQSAGKAPVGFPTIEIGEGSPASTWNEATYRKAEAKRNRKPDMMRTSAGEGSDSQEDFPLPENATAEQKTLRTRRLNRWRAKKARDLTCNRKAVKKLPYVIHVDGTSKPRGIHRHQWKAAVRGQCGRLDPTMDNINHHPKHVVDSIWHALEKEWEFEGFAHKAREMFEKSATKFMRNRKMQLKYKCQKAKNGEKPDDVSDTHWKKVVAITKKSVKQEEASTSSKSGALGKKTIAADVGSRTQASLELELQQKEDEHIGMSAKRSRDKLDEDIQFVYIGEKGGSEGGRLKRSSEPKLLAVEFVASEQEDVHSQIRNLRSQLEWLESSVKAQGLPLDNFTNVTHKLTQKMGTVNEVRKVSQSMKENVAPSSTSAEKNSSMYSQIDGKATKTLQKLEPASGVMKQTLSTDERNGEVQSSLEQLCDVNIMEDMECGDVVSMVAIIEDKHEDIGKGVLMGFAGSKFSRKVIPKGWCSIKVSSYTTSGGSEACPFPSGWKDQVKHKTVRDADGRLILWPDSLLHI